MPRPLGVLVIHGVGSQQPGYSAPLIDELTRLIGPASARIAWEEIHWAWLLQDRERALEAVMRRATRPDGRRAELDWKAVRAFVVHNVGDALAYHRDAYTRSAYAAVHRSVSNALTNLHASLDDRHAPVVVIAHSLGAHIMSNYIWDREHRAPRRPDTLEPIRTLIAMITLGCNIPLFSLAFDVARPIVLPGRSLRAPALRAAATWLNLYDRDDVLGWPLGPLYRAHLTKLTRAQRRTVGLIADREIDAGGPLTRWNPLSHEQYWTAASVTHPVARYLRRLLDLL